MKSAVALPHPRKVSLPRKKPPPCATSDDSGVCLVRSRSEFSSKSGLSFSILENGNNNSQDLIYSDSTGTVSSLSLGNDQKRSTVLQSYKQEYQKYLMMLQVLLSFESRCQKMEECLSLLRESSLRANFKEIKSIPRLSALMELRIDLTDSDEVSPRAEIQRYISIAQDALSGVYRIQKQNLCIEKDMTSFKDKLAKVEMESINISIEIGEVKKSILAKEEKEEGADFKISHFLIEQEDLEIPLCVWQKHEKDCSGPCGTEGMKEYNAKDAKWSDDDGTQDYCNEYMIASGDQYTIERGDQYTKECVNRDPKQVVDEGSKQSGDEDTKRKDDRDTKVNGCEDPKQSSGEVTKKGSDAIADNDSFLHLHKTEDSTIDILSRYVSLLLERNSASKHQENELSYVLARQSSMIRKLDIKRTEEQLRCLDLQSKLNSDTENHKEQESKLIEVDSNKISQEEEHQHLTDSLEIVEKKLKDISNQTFDVDSEISTMQDNKTFFSYSKDLYNAEILRLKRIQKKKRSKLRDFWRRLHVRDTSMYV